jgi:endoglucanase
VITLAANRGVYVLLDLHRFGVPREEHVAFWKDAAARYKDHPAVLFDLFNETHGTTWETWRESMQKLVDAVRGTGARNIVLAGGLDWGYDLSGVANGFTLDQRDGNGIIYGSHIYPWKKDWKTKVLAAAEKYPVLVGEVGCDVRPMPFEKYGPREDLTVWAPDMIGFMQKYKLHWTAFSFHPAATPVMITGWDYTPTPVWGALVKDALAGKQFKLRKLR